jgi:hypothetical protein
MQYVKNCVVIFMKISCPCKSEISESDVLFATWEKYLLNLQFFRPRRNRLS